MPVKQELVKEEVILTEIGRFMAYYSGRIYIAFVDKTILEMYWPQRIDSHCHNNKVLLHDHLQPGYCRLLLSNGQYKTLPVVHNPQPYQRYFTDIVPLEMYCSLQQKNAIRQEKVNFMGCCALVNKC